MEELRASYQRTHQREISDADEFTASVWQRIRDQLQVSLKADGLDSFPSVSQAEFDKLQNILEVDIPQLRRSASPSHFGSK